MGEWVFGKITTRVAGGEVTDSCMGGGVGTAGGVVCTLLFLSLAVPAVLGGRMN